MCIKTRIKMINLAINAITAQQPNMVIRDTVGIDITVPETPHTRIRMHLRVSTVVEWCCSLYGCHWTRSNCMLATQQRCRWLSRRCGLRCLRCNRRSQVDAPRCLSSIVVLRHHSCAYNSSQSSCIVATRANSW